MKFRIIRTTCAPSEYRVGDMPMVAPGPSLTRPPEVLASFLPSPSGLRRLPRDRGPRGLRSSDSVGPSGAPSPDTSGVLDGVTVQGTDAAPSLVFETTPLSVPATTTKVLQPGSGPALTPTTRSSSTTPSSTPTTARRSTRATARGRAAGPVVQRAHEGPEQGSARATRGLPAADRDTPGGRLRRPGQHAGQVSDPRTPSSSSST